MKRYNSYSDYLISKYGYKVYRVGVDAGFSCPNRKGPNKEGGCVYCDSQAAVAAYHRTSESSYTHASSFEKNIDFLVCKSEQESVQNQIDHAIAFIKRRYKTDHYALYFQSYSNTFAPVAKLKEIYDFALEGRVWEGLIVSTRPDCVDEEKLDLLASYKNRVKSVCIELGLQSGDDGILRKMNRGHSVECLEKAAIKAKQKGLEVCLHILTGFPGETYAELQKTVDVINKVKPDSIKIHNLNIAGGTALFNDYLNGEVTAPCSQRHIANTVFILRRISKDIVIERLIAETPSHRLASPRLFPDKNSYLRQLEKYMEENNYTQGDLYK